MLFISLMPFILGYISGNGTFLYDLRSCWKTIIPWLQVTQSSSITIASFPFGHRGDNSFLLVASPSIVVSINPDL